MWSGQMIILLMRLLVEATGRGQTNARSDPGTGNPAMVPRNRNRGDPNLITLIRKLVFLG